MRPYEFIPRVVKIDDGLREVIGRWNALKRRESQQVSEPDRSLEIMTKHLDTSLAHAQEYLGAIFDYYIEREQESPNDE